MERGAELGRASIIAAKPKSIISVKSYNYVDGAQDNTAAQIAERALRKTKKSPQPMNCGQVPYQEGG